MSNLQQAQAEKERLYKQADDVVDEILQDVSADNDSLFKQLNSINQEIIRKAKEIARYEAETS